MDDLKRLLHDAQRQQLLAVVAPLAHERIAQALHDRALRLAKALDLVPPGRVRDEHVVLGFQCNEVLQCDVADADALVGPLSEQLHLLSHGVCVSV